MGIRGFSTYISQRSHLYLRDHKLHDCTIIIDGNNLLHHLYNTCPGLNPAFGGDYDRISSYFKEFFELLQSCNIKPIVVCDGGLDINGRKSETRLTRAKQKLHTSLKVNSMNQGRIPVFPLMAKLTLVSVLFELKIETIQTEYEADEEIALLARSCDYYVLSNDSDFYVLDVQFIPLDSLSLSVTTADDNTNALSCSIFTLDYFVKRVGLSDKKIIPMLGTLLGNDYIKISLFENLFSQMHMPKSNRKMSDQHRRLQALLEWLKGQSVDGALKKVLSYVKKERRPQVETAIKQSLAAYSHDKESDFDCGAMRRKTMERLMNSGLPEKFAENYASCGIPAWVLEIRQDAKVPFHSQVESANFPSSLQCSWKFLEILGLLLNHKENRDKIQVLTRIKHKLVYHDLELDRTCFPFEVPDTRKVASMTTNSRKSFMLQVLLDGGSVGELKVPEDLQMIFGVIVYWTRNSISPVKSYHIDALIVSIIMLSVIDTKVGRIRSQAKFDNVSKRLNGELDENLHAVKNLRHFFDLEPKLRVYNNLYDKDSVHTMAEFQGVLYYTNALNSVLDFPFKMTSTGKIFNGLFVYNLINQFQKIDRSTLLQKLFGEQSSLLAFFHDFAGAVYKLAPSSVMEFQLPQPLPRRRRNKKKVNKTKPENTQEVEEDSESEESDDIISLTGNRFASLRL